MPNITNLTHPQRFDAKASHLEQGFVMGWVPGEITSLDDPEKIGRVRVRCDLIQPDTDLPNNNDSWIWVLEDFVNNATPGGTHRLLKVGAQVALLPMLGDPRQMLLLGCLPSRIDQPHPELDRSKETYGSATAGNVFDMKNDSNASEIKAYPHGVVKSVSPTGDITHQTAEHARTQLNQDGTARIENDKAFTMMTAQGDVTQKSKDGAKSTLTADGKVKIEAATESKLTLDGKEGKMEGPLSELSQTVKKIKETLIGNIGIGQQTLKELLAYAEGAIPTGTIESFLVNADNALTRLQKGLGENYGGGIEALKQLKSFSPQQLGDAISPQLEAFAGTAIAKAMPDLEKIVAAGQSAGDLLEAAQQVVPELKITDDLTNLVKGLSYDPKMQLQAILSDVLDDGFAAVENIIGINLHTLIEALNTAISTPIPEPKAEPGTPEHINEIEQNTRAYLKTIRDYLPQTVEQDITDATLGEIFFPKSDYVASLFKATSGIDATITGNGSAPNISLTQAKTSNEAPLVNLTQPVVAETTPSEKIEQIIGHAASKKVDKTEQQVSQAKDLVEAIERLRVLGRSLKLAPQGADFAKALADVKGTPFGHLVNLNHEKLFDHAAKEVLPKAISELEKQLNPILQQALQMLNQLINMIPMTNKGAVVKAMQEKAEIWADPLKKGGFAQVTSEVSELLGPKKAGEKRTRVFAGNEAVGLANKYGKLEFGGKNSLMAMLGNMAMRSLAPDGSAAGLLMGDNGASLSSFPPPADSKTKPDPEAKPADWGLPGATVKTEGNVAAIQSFAGQELVNQISVTPQGVFINNINAKILIDLIPQIALLTNRIDALTANFATLSSAIATLQGQINTPPPTP